MSWREATWTNGKTTVKGRYEYYWPSDKFFIEINKKNGLTGERIQKIESHRDEPEWGKWKLVRQP